MVITEAICELMSAMLLMMTERAGDRAHITTMMLMLRKMLGTLVVVVMTCLTGLSFVCGLFQTCVRTSRANP